MIYEHRKPTSIVIGLALWLIFNLPLRKSYQCYLLQITAVQYDLRSFIKQLIDVISKHKASINLGAFWFTFFFLSWHYRIERSSQQRRNCLSRFAVYSKRKITLLSFRLVRVKKIQSINSQQLYKYTQTDTHTYQNTMTIFKQEVTSETIHANYKFFVTCIASIIKLIKFDFDNISLYIFVHIILGL